MRESRVDLDWTTGTNEQSRRKRILARVPADTCNTKLLSRYHHRDFRAVSRFITYVVSSSSEGEQIPRESRNYNSDERIEKSCCIPHAREKFMHAAGSPWTKIVEMERK